MVASNTITINVAQAASVVTSITLSATSTSITVGGNDTFNGYVYDQYGNGMQGVAVSIYSGNSLIGTTTSGSGGEFSTTIIFSTSGTYSVTAQA
jgi:hypothetical protein